MNTNGLAKHYQSLTPEERLPMILAATERGDEIEAQRLRMSTPMVTYLVPDHFPLTLAFQLQVYHYFLDLMDVAAIFLECLAAGDASWADDRKHSDQMMELAGCFGFTFQVKLRGWEIFCEELLLNPDFCWKDLPGRGTIERAKEMAEGIAFSEEKVLAHFKKRGKEVSQVITPESMAADLQKCLKIRTEWWE